MEKPSEQPRFSKAIMTIAAVISALALNCAKPDMSQSTTPEGVPFKRKITADCSRQRMVDYQRPLILEGTRRGIRDLVTQCIKGTLKKTGRRKYECMIQATKLESVKCE